MSFRNNFLNTSVLVTNLTRYNLKIIFANKFLYFFAASLGVFLFISAIILLSAQSQPDEGTVYSLLLLPGLLVVFYPTAFGIQNDVDNRMIEILFGIPNYRYKVWLVRMVMIYILAAGILFMLSAMSSFALTVVPVFAMTAQLMFPIMFFGSLAFMISTIARSGGGTSVVMAIITVIYLMARDFFEDHRAWDIFLNPYSVPDDINTVIWQQLVVQNRVILVIGIAVALLYGLLNLQNRERYLY